MLPCLIALGRRSTYPDTLERASTCYDQADTFEVDVVRAIQQALEQCTQQGWSKEAARTRENFRELLSRSKA